MKRTRKLFAFILIIASLFVLAGCASGGAGEKPQTVSELDGKNIGAWAGSVFAGKKNDIFPNSTVNIYADYPDMIAALNAGKIAAGVMDRPALEALAAFYPGLSYIDEPLYSYELAAAFSKNEKGEKLRNEFSEYVAKMKADGTLDALEKKWMEDKDYTLDPKAEDLEDINGTLVLAVDPTACPYAFVEGDGIKGFDIQIAVLFCREYGYGLRYSNMGFSALLTALGGKCDFAMSGMAVTPEREKNVYFSESYFSGETVTALYTEPETDSTVFERFKITFIDEGRWKLFLGGLGTTALITLSSMLIGTALGFGLFIVCRLGSPAAKRIVEICKRLISGMPAVVLLLIMYYVIFGRVSISGTWVAVVCFSLLFMAEILDITESAVGTVDLGQYEAAYALGYTSRQTFFDIILPQAARHMFTPLKSAISSHIQGTAIVGYVAVQDLTRVSDLVRGSTFEAFFPLIVTAVVYYGITFILVQLVNGTELFLDPNKKDKKAILKGVKTDD